MTDDTRPEGVRTFRAPSGPVAMVIGVALSLFLLGDAVARAGWGQMLLLAPWVLLVLWVVYVNTFASVVRIDDQGAMVQNLLRRTTFGWSRVRGVDLRWQLTFSLEDGKELSCYGGPAKASPAGSGRTGERSGSRAGSARWTRSRRVGRRRRRRRMLLSCAPGIVPPSSHSS